jgi:hypothetical protein
MSTFFPALIAALILGLAIVFFVRRSRPAPTDAPEPGLSPTIHRVRANVRAILSQEHPLASVSSYGATELDPRNFTVTIDVRYDRERDEIRRDPLLRDRFRQALVDADYPASAIARVQFDVQSQQTVDRDFGGNWYQARK